MVERPWVLPVPEPNVTIARRTSTTVECDTEDNETDNGSNFDCREPKLKLAVPPHSHKVDDEDEHIENSDPGRDVDGRVPVLNNDGSGCQFCGKRDGIRVPVVHAKRKTYSWVDDCQTCQYARGLCCAMNSHRVA